MHLGPIQIHENHLGMLSNLTDNTHVQDII